MGTTHIWMLFISILSLFLYGVYGNKNVLVLGGNGFLGSAVVSEFIQSGYRISILNRGHQYYDSHTRIIPHVHKHFICDRDTYLIKTCKDLLTSGKYDAVVDFSSYSAFHVEQMAELLKGRVGLYIFISTDAVYEMCEKNHQGLTHEGDASKPYNASFKAKLRVGNKYGEQKLECEKVLVEQRQRRGFPYIILRLAEAIGPRDSTMRIWNYQLWIRLHKALKIPVSLPKFVKKQKFSLVYSLDVAKLIRDIIDTPPPESAIDKPFNLGFEQKIDLASLLHKLSVLANVSSPNYNSSDENGFFKFPTVEKGPLDIARAQFLLKWKPTKFDDALSATYTFNEDAMVNEDLVKEKETMLVFFSDDILTPLEFEDENLFIGALRDTYGPSVFNGMELFDVDPTQPLLDGGQVTTPFTKEIGDKLITKEENERVCYKDKCT